MFITKSTTPVPPLRGKSETNWSKSSLDRLVDVRHLSFAATLDHSLKGNPNLIVPGQPGLESGYLLQFAHFQVVVVVLANVPD